MLHRRLVAATLLLAASAPLGAQSVQAGTDAWSRGEYAAAVAVWRPLAEKGDADAQFNLAQAYRFGRGVPINLGAAQAWYERAANKGHVNAQYILGRMLFLNGNHTGGARWLKAAADGGEPLAMLAYGTALFNGDGVPQNQVLGYAYVNRAANKGLGAASDTLADMDQIMSPDDRKKGAALALATPKAPAPGAKPTKPVKLAAKPAAPKPAPKPAPPPVAAAVPPKPAPATPAPKAATGAWRIQLGAFSQRASAEALYRKLSGSLGGRQAFYIPVGSITRLQVGPYESKAAAAAACRSAGQACFPVPAK